ncbi:S-adenosyl-L-methionine-dependent methyltransferase [Hygrophoropsis aurantiaca]|uniref:S-adenosyl-L-methionine-dependent methyltransferase n=1 Tax=Hygrophoropsis aurantiaca TaxID=72124 RepID=A0ACB7ZZN4_9AGAM|nr:S-adenosyl-L-methionine-dependent methyltransferase [Hygrophoropsis aurantiaca]
MPDRTPLDAAQIAPLSLHNATPLGLQIQLGQTAHRIVLASLWQIKPGDRVLEIGCGQGDCTAVIAAAVGEEGSVVAVDPAPLDYGSPYTLGEAQAHLKASRLGSRITFVRASTAEILAADATVYDVAVLAHSLWYFSSPSAIRDTLRALSARARRVCLAEWALVASHPGAAPHLLAALAQAALECRIRDSTSNIRTVVSPEGVKALARTAGLELESERTVAAPEGMMDGQWEVGAMLRPEFGRRVEAAVADERERGVVLAMRDAVRASKEALGGEKVRAMDVWAGSFKGQVDE